MTQDISNLMDGELDPRESGRAIQACCASEEAARTWNEYHLIGEVLRRESPSRSRVLERVREGLAQEPTVLAPRTARPSANVVRISLAAAASVVTVAVVGWIGVQQGAVPAGSSVARGPAPVQGGLATVASQQPAVAIAPLATTPVVVHSQDIQDYMVAHRQTPSSEFYRPVAAKGP